MTEQPPTRAETSFPFQAVLWDIDGTLADSEPVHERSFVETCAALELTLPEDFHDFLLGRTDRDTYLWLVQNCGLTVSEDTWVAQRFARYFELIDDVKPYPGSVALWRQLTGLGLRQATVSNSDRMITQRNLERLGLTAPGLVSIARNDVQSGKPSPEGYLRAATLLGVAPQDCAVVEDSETGRQAAMAAGMTVFMMPWYRAPDGVHGYRGFEELAAAA